MASMLPVSVTSSHLSFALYWHLESGVGRCSALTILYRVDVARCIAADAGKTYTTLTASGRRFGFRCSLSRLCKARMGLPFCYTVVKFSTA